MGCDIHAYLEYMDHGEMDLFAELHLSRNYSLFEMLACGSTDSRTEGWELPISEQPRGLPGDLGLLMESCVRQAFDAHTHSWLTDAEFAGILNAAGFDIPEDWQAAKVAVCSFVEGRVVFWFDN